MKSIILSVCLALFILLFSCSVRQDVNLNLDSSGGIDLTVELEPVFVSYLFDIAEATTEIDSPGEMQIFNTLEIREALEKQPGITIEHILSRQQQLLEVKLQCRDLPALARSIGEGSHRRLISYRKADGASEFAFYLDKNNYKDMKKLFPPLDDPAFETFEPREGENINEMEYLDIIEFTMEEEGREAVAVSYINVKIRVQGRILSQEGGRVKDGFIFLEIPLLDVLLLNKPVEFSVKFK